MGKVAEHRGVALPPERAYALWTDLRRWPTFVEGFARAERADGWPGEGAKLVWESVPGGRGTVTERVREASPPGRLVTDVYEERLEGRQTVTFQPEDGGSRARIDLDYTLLVGGPLRSVTDVLFVRRALRESLARTLARFGAEATEEAGL